MPLRTILLLLLLFSAVHSYGQTAGFLSPDTVCINSPVNIQNTSVGATTYNWSFCQSQLTTVPEAVNLGNPGGLLNLPVYVDFVQDNSGNYFVFAVNNVLATVVRMNFGNSLLNNPIVDNLGNFGGAIPQNAEGIQLVNINGNWTAIIAGGDPASGNPSSIAKIDFGTSLATTTPSATNWGNIGGLNYPLDMFIFKESGNWYGYTVNSRNNTISRISFGTDFSTSPTGINLGNLGGLNIPTGLGAINSSGNWFLFIANDGNGTLSRLSFGNSLLNTPTTQNIGNPGGALSLPRDISFIQVCNNLEAFVVNSGTNTLTRLDFGNDIMSLPSAASLGNLGSLDFPHSISKLFIINNDIYCFIPNVNSNTLTRLRFAGCNTPGSTMQNPTTISYSQPGTYNINLMIDVGLPTETSACRQIVVNDCPLHTCNNWLGLPSQPSFVGIGDLDIPGNQITVEAEFNRTTPYLGGFLYAGDLVSKHKDPVNTNYLLRPSDAEITTADGVYHITPPVCDIQLNKTYHVAMVYDGATLKFYRNGFLLSQVAVTGNLFQNDFQTQIGLNEAQLYTENLIGYINEVRIWNVARTQAQIQAYMNSSLPSPTTQTGLLAYYTFDDLLNKQGNPAWNGTLNGAAAINQTNPNCIFTGDNDCCPAIQGTFIGNSICPGQTGYLTFIPTTLPANPPFTLSFSDQVSVFDQTNVQSGQPFPVVTTPAGTTLYPLLKITDAAKCSTTITGETATITVFQPGQLTITPDTSICLQADAQLYVSGGGNFTWTPATLVSNPSIYNPVASPVVTTKFYVAGQDLNNCTVKDSVTVSIIPAPVFKSPLPTAVCKGSSVLLDGNNDSRYLYTWSPAALLNNPSLASPTATPDQSTVFHLDIADPVCAMYDSGFDVEVMVHPVPVMGVQKSNDINCSVLNAKLTATGAESYIWTPAVGLSDPESSSPMATISTTTKFVVKGSNAEGCYAYDSVTVVVSKTGENFFSVPNAFTPNGDNVNDCFGIRSWGTVTIRQFSIYNRWGQKVFDTKNPSACWDGTFQGELQDSGGFVYIIRASSFCGDVERRGTVLLIR